MCGYLMSPVILVLKGKNSPRQLLDFCVCAPNESSIHICVFSLGELICTR